MKIPLLCDVGEDTLSIVHNSSRTIAAFPFKPHLYAPTTRETRIYRKAIGTREIVPLEKMEADTISGYDKIYTSVSCDKPKYIEQIYTEIPDYFLQYPNTGDLKILSLDIETLTDGSGIFPRATESPMTAIGMKMDGVEYIYSITREELDSNRSTCDYRILEEFIGKFYELDPDIVCTYNGIKFDLPYILTRLGINNTDPRILSRYHGDITPDSIPGRIHWDMWNDVQNDQTLLGLPNRRLKTIGHHFGWSDIIDLGRDTMSNNIGLVGSKDLDEYLSSDIRLTEQLVDVYIHNHISLGEMMGMPLREVINSYSSLIPKVYHIRNLKDKWIGLRTNSEKYSERLAMRYEAARVAIYDNGRQLGKEESLGRHFPKVWKVDFASQYPTAIITFNLSPETCYISSIKPYTGVYEFKNTGRFLYLNIPDTNAQKRIVIKIDMKKDGFLRKGLSDLKSMRDRLKKISKDNLEDKEAYSQQWAIKVLMNAVYGYNGLSSSRWGDLAVAIGTVGVCRWLIMRTEEYLGNSIICTDSVTGITPICILRDDKYIDFLPISELVPSGIRMVKSTRYKTIPKNMKVLTRNGWKHILYVKQYLSSKKIYRINTTDGYVETTEDHSLFTKEQVEIKPTELKRGGEVEIRSIPTHSYKVDYSEDFAWLLGFILAEGTVTVNDGSNGKRIRNSLIINNQNQDTLKKCAEILREHYLLECVTYDTMKSSAVYKLIKDNKYMASDLNYLCYTIGGSKKVPLFVLNGPDNIKNAFLSGLWDGDGHIGRNRVYREEVGSIHHTLAAGIRYLINSIGIRTGIAIRSDKPNYLDIKKRKMSGTHVRTKINDNLVKKVELLNNENSNWVYDISTEDGTFVTGLGGIVLHNTDGVMTSSPVDIDHLNNYLAHLIQDTFEVPCEMELELEECGEGYFYRAKNYLLRKDGVITRKGNVFKSSKHSQLYSKALDIVVAAVLDQTADYKDIIRSLKEWGQYSMTDYIMSISYKQDPEEYTNPNSMQPAMARLIKKELDTDIGIGDSIDYIVTRDNAYTPASLVSSLDQIDYDYYENEIDKIFRIFNISTDIDNRQLTIEFGNGW